jgi:non-specific serine/threonine protein kinase
MLETVREFALEQLALSGEDLAIREAHAVYCLHLVERSAPELHTRQQLIVLAQLTMEHGNLRAALDWFDHADRMVELTRLAWALFWFWWFRGHLVEGLGWYERALSKGVDLPASLRGSALFSAAQFAWTLGDASRAEVLAREAQALEPTSGQPFIPGLPELMLSVAASMHGESATATSLGEAALTRLRQVGTWEGEVWLRIALNDIGLNAAQALQGAHGMALIEEALARVRIGDDPYLTGVHWSDLGLAAQAAGDAAKATHCYVEGLRLLQEVGGEWYLATPLAGLAAIEMTRDPAWAAQLLGAADALRERGGQPNWPLERDRDEHTLAVLRALLGEEQLAQRQSQGRERPLSAILARAVVDHAGKTTSTSVDGSASTGDLSSREVEVLRLLVAGCSDREIAERLFISPRTASKHVGAILTKLEVTSRGEAAVRAVRDRLG